MGYIPTSSIIHREKAKVLESSNYTIRKSDAHLDLNMSFDRLIRFLDKEGVERRGNVKSDLPASELPGKEVQLLSGSFYSGYNVTDERAVVAKVSKEFDAYHWFH